MSCLLYIHLLFTNISRITLPCVLVFICSPLKAYIVRSTTLTLNLNTGINTVTFYYDIHYAQPTISHEQAQALGLEAPTQKAYSQFKIIEAPTGSAQTLFVLIDQLIGKIISSAGRFLTPQDLSTLNLKPEQLSKTRAPLGTLLLPILGNLWCTTHSSGLDSIREKSEIYCIDNRLGLLIIYELIDLLVLLKSYCIINMPQQAFSFLQEINKSLILVDLSSESLFTLADTMLEQALTACQAVIDNLTNKQSKQQIQAFAQELTFYREVNKKACQFLDKINKTHKPFFPLLIERIDKFAPFTGTSFIPILGDNYTKFIEWFLSNATKRMLLDIFILELITKTSPCAYGQIVVGASHAEHIISLLLLEGYQVSHDTLYTLADGKSKVSSLHTLLRNNPCIYSECSLETLLKPLIL